MCGCHLFLDHASPPTFVYYARERTLNPSRTEYEYLEQGSAVFRREAVLPEETVPSRASFSQGDACSLDVEKLGSFDAVLASNLLCRCVPTGSLQWMFPRMLDSMGLAHASTVWRGAMCIF